jgi:hypothetical protein
MIGVGFVLYGWILLRALLSGWKEQVIVVTGLLLVILYPKYKRTVTITGGGVLLLLISVLPAYNQTFRQLNWNQGVEAEQAAYEAIERIEAGQVNPAETAWGFLTGRLSRVQMFAEYVEHTPSHHPYYGFSIIEQGIESIIPRVFWPGKPVLEEVAMRRVYENQVSSRASSASVKPPLLIDGYLSGGAIGVLILLFTGYVEFSDQTWTSPLIRGVVVLVLVFFPLHTWKKRVGIWSIAGRTTADKWERL